jgi:GH15 family glucan-1,4-alpha-glucosidase
MTTTTSAQDIVAEGLRVIADGQAPSGAYVASPAFPEYNFAWLRDGAYCALAMDAAGRSDSSRAFHRWAAMVVEAQRSRIEKIIGLIGRGDAIRGEDMLPTRYTLIGKPEVVVGEGWPNFQLDGYGSWLFALFSHLDGHLLPEFRPAVELAARYLSASWRLPCFDYWEEFGDRQHTSTLAAIAAGLRAASRLLDDASLASTAEEVLDYLWANCVVDGSFVKGPQDARVDASLISLAVPFGLVETSDPVITATIGRIRSELSSPSGGIYRYRGDTYYGGNPWLLLTAWLGWHDRVIGNEEGHSSAREWVLGNVSAGGRLAEQILHEPQAAPFVQEWIDRWGPVANPLLWSHAKFILMESEAVGRVWN